MVVFLKFWVFVFLPLIQSLIKLSIQFPCLSLPYAAWDTVSKKTCLSQVQNHPNKLNHSSPTGFEFDPANAKSLYSFCALKSTTGDGKSPSFKIGKTPVLVPGTPAGVTEGCVNRVTVTTWCNRALGGLTLHTSCISARNRHLLQNCQVSHPLLLMKDAASRWT